MRRVCKCGAPTMGPGSTRCHECNRKYLKQYAERYPERVQQYNRKWLYGITTEGIEEFKVAQGGKCAMFPVCSASILEKFDVDHDHHTGKVRGLVCHSCNIRVGGMDDPEYRARALEYLEQFQIKNTKEISHEQKTESEHHSPSCASFQAGSDERVSDGQPRDRSVGLADQRPSQHLRERGDHHHDQEGSGGAQEVRQLYLEFLN